MGTGFLLADESLQELEQLHWRVVCYMDFACWLWACAQGCSTTGNTEVFFLIWTSSASYGPTEMRMPWSR